MAKAKGYYANGYYHGYVPSVANTGSLKAKAHTVSFCVKEVKFSD